MTSFIQQLMNHARWEANAMRSGVIRISHVFCGLTKFPNGPTYLALKRQGYEPVIVRRQIRGLIGRPDFWLAPESFTYSEEVKSLLERVSSVAEELKRSVSEFDVTYALLNNAPQSPLFDYLEVLEIDREELIEAVIELDKDNYLGYLDLNKREEEEVTKTNFESESLCQLQNEIETLGKKFSSIENIKTNAPAMLKLKIELAKLSNYQSDILIYGETGTGKEIFARAIHEVSGCSGPLVPINCGAIPKELFESELFGHRKGAFSGAVADKKGAFELANFGTLFLDEIGELPIDLQPKLLRAIEYREIRPVGSPQTMNLNLKIVFATNRDLKQEVEKGNFREDLFFRISSPCLSIPPLRVRRDDIPLLFNHFLEQAIDKYNKTNIKIPKKTLDTLRRYNWPGNVRELKKAVEEAVMRSDGEVLCTVIPPGRDQPITLSKAAELPKTNKKEKFSDTQLLHWMKELDGQKNLVAEKLGVSYRTVLRRCKKLGL